MSPGRLATGGVVLLAALASGWFVVRTLDARDFRAALDRAERDRAAGRLATAEVSFKALAGRRPGEGEVWYRLGLCERARGNVVGALSAWERVAPGTRFDGPARVARARLLIDTGRFADAERLLEPAPPGDADHRQTLELLYRLEGRRDDVRALILESWTGSADPSLVLRRLYLLDHSAFPVAMVRASLDRGDPGDDRVWLGRANLAVISGRLDEAGRLLDACRARRPDDPPVWRAALDLALAAGDSTAVLEASRHLPASRFPAHEVLRIRAWLAARCGDPGTERKALDALAAQAPGDTSAWDRLAESALAQGRSAEAETFRRRKGEINGLLARYKSLILRDDRSSRAGELAGVADRLGRRAEARGWFLIAEGRAGGQALDLSDAITAGVSHAPLFESLADLAPRRTTAPRVLAGGEPTIEYTDDAVAAGLAFVYDNGHTARRRPPPPEAMGGGVGLLDFDGDGWLDVYVVQGGPFPPGPGAAGDGDRLFRNQGDGTFGDVTTRAGIAAFARGFGHGVAVGDFDNDGFPDLFVTRWRGCALYRNKGDGTFEDATTRAGLGGDRDWPTSAAFADLDNDGDLDLYVCHYLAYDEFNPRRCEHPDEPSRHDCNPLDFEPLPDHAFRNDGGRFVDVTAAAGLAERSGRGLGVVATDLDGDGRVDLYVANDMSANFLYRNLGGFRFEEVGLISGSAASAEGGYKAGMGVACGDLDGDGRADLAVTNYFGESTTFYRNLGRGVFGDRSDAVGMSAPTRLLLGFGIAFLDADDDGRLDVLSANGHVTDGRPKFPFAMPLQLLAGGPGGRLADVSPRSGPPFVPEHLGRGLAVGDLDNDGRLDALVVCQNEPMAYLHNRTPRRHHVAVFRLEGTASNRDGVGATLTVRCGPRSWVVPRFGGGSYQSASDPRLHVGLGDSARIDSVEVRWPSGRVDRHEGLAVDAGYRLREGDPAAHTLRGWGPRPVDRAGTTALSPPRSEGRP